LRRDGSVVGACLWRNYLLLLRNGRRLRRVFLLLLLALVVLVVERGVIHGEGAEIPIRGLEDRELFINTLGFSAIGLVILLVVAGDATVLTWRFIIILNIGRTIYPRLTVERFATELWQDIPEEVCKPIAASAPDRGKGGTLPRNSLLDPWIDAHLLAEHTAAIGPLIVLPFVVLGLLVVARSQLFDNWAINNIVLATLLTYLLWAVAMAALLNVGAEMARRRAIESMKRDLRWLEGKAGENYEKLAKRFPSLIEDVRDLRRGAFAPFLEQPLVRAILVPLGGAGGVQLLEMFMFARS
jgi:hypothetical protein